MSSLKSIAASGVRWTASSSIAVTVIQFIQVATLARLLSPSDFGLMAMVAVVLGLAQAYSDMGISNAIIYRQDTTADQLSSLYWLNIFAGIVAFAVVISVTPLIVAMYSEPRLFTLVRLAAPLFLITPWGLQFQILLQKELQFHILAQVEIGAALAGCVVAIASAFAGLGVYSMLAGQLVSAVVTAANYIAIGWRRWPPALHFRRADVRGYLGFGLFQMGERSINFLSSRTDQLLIGIMIGPIGLGYYTLAWNLVIQPVMKINPILTRIAFPLFARVQKDNDRLRRGFSGLVWLLTTVNAPILIGLAVIAPIGVPEIFGGKWLPAILIVQILSFAGLFRAIGNPVGSLLLAKGRADLGFYWNVAVLCTQVPGIYLGIRLGGLEGAGLALLVLQLAYSIGNYPILVRPLIGRCLVEYVMSQAPPLLIASAMGAVVLLIAYSRLTTGLLLLGVQILIGAIVYIALSAFFEHDRLRETRNTLFGHAHPGNTTF